MRVCFVPAVLDLVRSHRSTVYGRKSHGVMIAAVAVTVLGLSGVPSAAGACSWQVLNSANPGSNNVLAGVSTASASDVWAVGKFYTPSFGPLTLAEHWSGSAWSVVSTPNPSGAGNELVGVADIAKSDAWAVGDQLTPSGGAQALIIHWNGKSWSQVSAPPIAGSFTTLFGVTAISAKDVWAVGRSFGPGVPAPYMVHWNGRRWSVVSTPNPGTFGGTLGALSATGPSDIWAAGGSYSSGDQRNLTTLAEHWNGKKWSVEPTPNANGNDNLFNAVIASTPKDAWAIGNYYTGSIFQTLIEHWNGATWTIVPTPNVGTFGDALFAAARLSSKSVWAVGRVFTSSGSTGGVTLSLKWNGKKWISVKSPNLGGGTPDFFTGAAGVPGTTALWAVGLNTFPSGNADLTLAARNACADSDSATGADDAPAVAPYHSRPAWAIRRPSQTR